MNFSALDYALWAANFLGVAVLFSILIFQRRWREFPVFTLLMGFSAVTNVLLYAINSGGSLLWYERVYITVDCLAFVLELGVVWEIARVVLRPTGSWVWDAKKLFIFWGAAGLLLAAAMPWLLVPLDATSPARLLRVWDTRSGLFVDVVLSELVTVLLLTSNRLGLGWRNHVMALANGWGISAAIGIVVNGLHGYLGMQHGYDALDQVAEFAFPIVYAYWIIQFWREEPARRPLSPELSAYILALHESVKNNLDTVNAQR